jgi:hypothetical protein
MEADTRKHTVSGHFSRFVKGLGKHPNGWLATQCTSNPSAPKFPANREFYREITILGPKATISKQETAAPPGLFRKFPKQTIREIFPTNREVQADNREFRDKSGSVHFFTLAWWRTSTSALPSSAFAPNSDMHR